VATTERNGDEVMRGKQMISSPSLDGQCWSNEDIAQLVRGFKGLSSAVTLC